MIKETLILSVKYDEEYGAGNGLVIPGINPELNYTPAQGGVLIAHDLLEHVNGPALIGSIDDELEALGAIWFIRGQNDQISRGTSFHSPHENIASDIVRMFRDYFYGAHVDIQTQSATDAEIDDCPAEWDFREIINIALNKYEDELDSDDKPEVIERMIADYQSVLLARLVSGYNKAKQRFNDESGYACELFWAIADCIDKNLKHAELNVGQQFELGYSLDSDGNIRVWFGEHYEIDEETEEEETDE